MGAVLFLTAFAQSASDPIQKLGDDFWIWRARYGQYTSDDINRMERPTGVVRDWSAGAVAQQRKELFAFEDRWKKLSDPKAPILSRSIILNPALSPRNVQRFLEAE